VKAPHPRVEACDLGFLAEQESGRIESCGARGVGVRFDLALIHLELGNRGPALDALDAALFDSSQMQGYVSVEPALDARR